jgi:hypothetical protein
VTQSAEFDAFTLPAGQVCVKPLQKVGTEDAPEMQVVTSKTAGVGSGEVSVGHAVQAQKRPLAGAAHTSAAVYPDPAEAIAVGSGYQQVSGGPVFRGTPPPAQVLAVNRLHGQPNAELRAFMYASVHFVAWYMAA